jgi:hypothetical protein
MELEVVPDLVAAALADPGLAITARCEALALLGRTQAVRLDPLDAEAPFRQLLRLCPAHELAPDTEPRTLGAFRKVQAEERERSARAQQAEVQRLIGQLRLDGGPSLPALGGQPLRVQYQLTDPEGSVRAVSLAYRRAGERDFSILPLRSAEGSGWAGEIPAEWTENQAGLVVEYHVATAGPQGIDLLQVGDAERPLTLNVAAGEIPRPVPWYRAWWFWAAVGGGVALAGAGAYFAVDSASALPAGDVSGKWP